MDDTLFDESQKPITNFSKNLNGLFFGYGFVGLLLEVIFEINVAELLDNVVVVIALHDIKELNDVGGF